MIIIDDEPVIRLTRPEYDKAMSAYQQACNCMVNPPSFEAWVRSQRENYTAQGTRGLEL